MKWEQCSLQVTKLGYWLEPAFIWRPHCHCDPVWFQLCALLDSPESFFPGAHITGDFLPSHSHLGQLLQI